LPAIYAPPNLEYLREGDVVALRPSGVVSVLYRRASLHNTILATERCNSLCLMCSQPPKARDDSYRVGEILRLLELIDPETRELGVSGGEPTLLRDSFFAIVEKAERCLPQTALHVLTNGRNFKDAYFARRLGATRHHDMMLGIPLYSDIDWRHDYVVQAPGAYDETLAGFYNLARSGVRTELRVVLHRQTVERLPQLAEFIVRNLPFVEQVALMGLEMFGFTPRNLDVLWIDPADYGPQLEAATRTIALAGMRVLIYNHQLCTIPRSLWPFAVRSISDWKNVYLDPCAECGVREYCGGFFQSATKRHSAHIHPLPVLSPETERIMNGGS
jgi:His-Xaa-Ser system radical SAM maturase HxsC